MTRLIIILLAALLAACPMHTSVWPSCDEFCELGEPQDCAEPGSLIFDVDEGHVAIFDGEFGCSCMGLDGLYILYTVPIEECMLPTREEG